MSIITTNLGKVVITPKGSWSSLVTYEKLDLVTSVSGSSYISLTDNNINHALSDTDWWQVVANVDNAVQNANDAATNADNARLAIQNDLALKADQADLVQLAGEFQKVLDFLQIGYWVHGNTGVTTYFGLDDPSIEDGIMSSPSWGPYCSEVKIPVGVTSLEGYCFMYSGYLTSITLPESVTSLGEGCFSGCQSLNSINIPEGVTSLGDNCFTDCSSLTSITLPESVTSLGAGCFYYCSSLTLATVLPAIPPSLGSMAFDYVHTSFNIKVRPPYVDDYKAATNWIEFADIIFPIA